MRLFGALSALGVALVVAAAAACGGDDEPGAASSGDGGAEGGPVTGPDGASPGTDAMTGPTADCGPANVKKGYSAGQTISVGGANRTYDLFVPDTYDNKKFFPVVVVFHGDGGDGANIRGSFKLEAEAAGAAIFVYPDGDGQTWGTSDAAGLIKDTAFIDAVVADLGKTHCTDKKRLFAVGFSRGAYFANLYACVSKSAPRAVVAHSGGGPYYFDGTGATYDNKVNDVACPAPPEASLQIIGGADDLLPDAKKARDHWERVNACKATSKAYDPSPCIAYDGCATDRPEVYCEIPGMGHQLWTNAPKTVWDFLKTK